MTRTFLVKELDRQLAEARAILIAMKDGLRNVRVLERERVQGASRLVVEGR